MKMAKEMVDSARRRDPPKPKTSSFLRTGRVIHEHEIRISFEGALNMWKALDGCPTHSYVKEGMSSTYVYMDRTWNS